MFIHAISNKNQAIFGAIYVEKKRIGESYTQNQQNTIDKIAETLKEPLEKFGTLSAETFYKSKKGIDFHMESSQKYDDAVSLEGYLGVKQIGTGIEESITYKAKFPIGIYNKENPFKIEDIEYGLKEGNKYANGFLIIAGTIVSVFLLLLIALGLGGRESEKAQNITKPLIDSIGHSTNKIDTTIKNAVNFIKK